MTAGAATGKPGLSGLATAGVLLLAGWLLWLVLRAMLVPLVVDSRPELAAQLLPAAPRALLIANRGDLLGAEGSRALLLRVGASAPLAPQPYRRMGAGARAAGDLSLALRYYEAAYLRDARDTGTILRLLELYTRLGQYPQAVDAADRLMRLPIPWDVRQRLAPAMSAFTLTEPGRVAVARALSRDPPWRGFYLRAGDAFRRDPRLIFEMLERAALESETERAQAEQSAFLNMLVARGEYDLAQLAFVNFLPKDFVRSTTVYDGEFNGAPGPAPFNWTFRKVRGNGAQLARDANTGTRYLAVNYSRRGPAIAEQITRLGAGPALLMTRLRSSEPGVDAGLVWRLFCAEQAVQLAELPAGGGSEDWQTRGVRITVPATGCTAQRLRLVPTREAVGEASVELDFVRLVREGAAQ